MAETAVSKQEMREAALDRVVERQLAAELEEARERRRGFVRAGAIRQRHAVAERRAELSAAVDEELAAREAATDSEALWGRYLESADKAIEAARRKVLERCRALGLSESYMPKIEPEWPRGREHRRATLGVHRYAVRAGQNVPGGIGPVPLDPSAAEARLRELRRLAEKRIDELERAALAAIRGREAALLDELAESDDPRSLELVWPDIAELMGPVTLADVDDTGFEPSQGGSTVTGHE